MSTPAGTIPTAAGTPRRRLGHAVAVGLFAGLVLFPNLGGYALWDPDEARHAEVAREMLAAKDWRGWIVPSFNFRPYHDKPILFYWAVAAVGAVNGLTEASARLVPAVAALATVLVAHRWASHVWDAATGLRAAAVLVTAVEFAGLGRYADLDMLLTLWITLGLLAFHRWTEEPGRTRWLAVASAAAALGALTKGLVAPVLVGGIGLLHLAAARQLRLVTLGRLAGAIVVFVAVAGPWYAAAWLVDPAYLREFFLQHHVARFLAETGELHAKPAWFPLAMLVAGFFPWSVFLPATIRQLRDRHGPAELLCACWSVAVLGFFTVSGGKLGTYVLPAFPPLALLTARYLGRLERWAELPVAERRLVTAGVLVVTVVSLAAAPALLAVTSRIYDGAWRRTSLLATAAIPLGLALPLLLRRGRADLVAPTTALGMLVLLALFYRVGAPAVSAVVSEAPLASTIAAHGVDGAPVVAYDVHTPSLVFYLRRPVRRTTSPADLAKVVAAHPLVLVVTSPRHVPAMLAAAPLYPWRTGGRHVLYGSRPP